jgi:Ca2+-binding EF-hand superfamily protein
MKQMLSAAVLAAATACAACAAAQAPQQPYVPKEQRIPSQVPPASGEALHAQVAQKLRERFNAADADHSGTLTQAEAQKAALGYVSENFDAIDTGHRGEVTFEQVQAWLQQRGMALRKP